MEAPKRKVTAKLTAPHDVNGHAASSPSPPPQIVIRSKVSGTARTRKTSTTSATSNVPANLRPQPRAAVSTIARRSPSPSKFQSAPHLQTSRPVRAPFSKVTAAALKPNIERARHGSISSMLSLGGAKSALREDPSSSSSAPTTPLPRDTRMLSPTMTDVSREPRLIFPPAQANGDVASGININGGPQRIKAKVSGLVKPKPSGSSSPSHIPSSPSTALSSGAASTFTLAASPFTTRTRAATLAPRRTSDASHAPQLVPLPTSPPASTLSFSSHSSTSASSAQSYSTSTTPPLSSLAHHARSRSVGTAENEDSAPVSLSPTGSKQLQQNLIARVRPGTNVSGGQAWTSTGSSLSGGPDLQSDSDDSDAPDSTPLREDDERAEAKSNRKIADLEITTRSLLAINASLEATKVRQARELRDMRRRLRETRLVLPPRAYRKLQAEDPEPDAEADDEDDEDADADRADGDDDERFVRLRALVVGLLDAGRRALAERVRVPGEAERLAWEGGQHGVAIGSRVLSPEEARSWAEGGGEGGGGEEHEHEHEHEAEVEVEAEVEGTATPQSSPPRIDAEQ